ncbi:tRNA-dihydrouridine synthase, partial [Marine Group I thaumarchaeote]|nr:tRNA-dihydrouridine synthase [Marine Group I thaumarchaeote]
MLPKFSSRAFLAPMAGVSDPALRLQCKQKGAGLVVTEFTNIH